MNTHISQLHICGDIQCSAGGAAVLERCYLARLVKLDLPISQLARRFRWRMFPLEDHAQRVVPSSCQVGSILLGGPARCTSRLQCTMSSCAARSAYHRNTHAIVCRHQAACCGPFLGDAPAIIGQCRCICMHVRTCSRRVRRTRRTSAQD